MSTITDLKTELKEVSEKLEEVNDFLKKITDRVSDEEIGVGSKVLLTQLSPPIEGRVWRVKPNNIFAVNRDGYAAELLVARENLKHLSVGTYGKFEKQQWLLQDRIKYLQQAIDVQINKDVFGIKELLCKGIDFITAKSIINRKDFQAWYKLNQCEQSIALTELGKASPIFICGMAREFIIASPNDIIWHAVIQNSVK